MIRKRNNIFDSNNIYHVIGFKPRLKGTIGKLANFDSDRDGVPDSRDCAPFNKHRHGIKPSRTTRERMKGLPLLLTKEATFKRDIMTGKEQLHRDPIYHVLSKEAKRENPKGQRQVFQIFKRYPAVLGEIERQRPVKITFVTKPDTHLGFALLQDYRSDVYIYPPELKVNSKEEYIKEATEFIKQNYPKNEIAFHLQNMKKISERYPFLDDPREIREKKRIESMAKTAFHELKHVEQKRSGGEEKIKREFETHEYHFRPHEIEAREHALMKISEMIEKGEPLPPEAYELLELYKNEL